MPSGGGRGELQPQPHGRCFRCDCVYAVCAVISMLLHQNKWMRFCVATVAGVRLSQSTGTGLATYDRTAIASLT